MRPVRPVGVNVPPFTPEIAKRGRRTPFAGWGMEGLVQGELRQTGPTGLIGRDPLFREARYAVLRPLRPGTDYPYHDRQTGAVVDQVNIGGRWQEVQWFPRRRHGGLFPPHQALLETRPTPRIPFWRRPFDPAVVPGPKQPFTPLVGPPGFVRLPGGHLVPEQEAPGAVQIPGWQMPGMGWIPRHVGQRLAPFIDPAQGGIPGGFGPPEWERRRHLYEARAKGEPPRFPAHDLLAGHLIPQQWLERGRHYPRLRFGMNGMMFGDRPLVRRPLWPYRWPVVAEPPEEQAWKWEPGQPWQPGLAPVQEGMPPMMGMPQMMGMMGMPQITGMPQMIKSGGMPPPITGMPDRGIMEGRRFPFPGETRFRYRPGPPPVAGPGPASVPVRRAVDPTVAGFRRLVRGGRRTVPVRDIPQGVPVYTRFPGEGVVRPPAIGPFFYLEGGVRPPVIGPFPELAIRE